MQDQKRQSDAPPRNKSAADLTIYISGVHGPKGFSGEMPQGLALVFEFSNGQNAPPIAATSKNKRSNNQRAEAEALLLALQWCETHLKQADSVRILSVASYVYDDIAGRHAELVQKDRANKDIVSLVGSLLVRNPKIFVERVPDDEHSTRMHDDAKELANHARKGTKSNMPGVPEEVGAPHPTRQELDELWKRAMERDPYG